MLSKFASLVVCSSVLAAAPVGTETGTFAANNGVVSFDAKTNFSAISVHGKADQMIIRFELASAAQQMTLRNVEARVDPAVLSTGMGVRDRHMREKVFTTHDGKLAELRFHADEATCPVPTGNEAASCEVGGTFFLRDVGRPFKMMLKVRRDDKQGHGYRVTGDGTIQLSDYAIEPPAQLGVRMNEQVTVRIEFVAKEHSGVSARL